MTVSSVVNHEQYTGNGVTTVFQYRFRVLSASHLDVTVMDTAENITSLVLGTDYTVTGVGVVNGGNIVLTNPLADEWQISIDRSPPAVQETDLRNQGNFFAEVHEDVFDYLTMLVQRALSVFSLALQKPSWLSKYYDAKNNRIANLADPVNQQDSVNRRFVENLFVDESASVSALKSQLQSNAGAGMIGTSNGSTVQKQLNSITSVMPEHFGLATDTLNLLAAVAYGKANGVNVNLIPGKTYTFTGTQGLEIDLGKFSFGCIFGQAKIDFTDFSGVYAIWVHSSLPYPSAMYQNTTRKMQGIEFFGNITLAGVSGLLIGNNNNSDNGTYNGQCLIKNCSWYNFDTLVLCTNSTWRYKFVECMLSSATAAIFNAPSGLSDSGESISFRDCQISDAKGAAIIIGCNNFTVGFPGSSILNTPIITTGNGVILDLSEALNIENPRATAWFRYASISGNQSRMLLRALSLTINSPDIQTRPVFYVGQNAYITFIGVRLPGNAYKFETNNTDGIRAFVEGPGYVNSSKVIGDQGGAGNIPLHPSLCPLYNWNFETGDTTGWTINNAGQTTQTAVVSTDSAKVGSYGLRLTSISGFSIFASQTFNMSVGDFLLTQFWARVVSAGTTGAAAGNLSVTYLSSSGVVIGGASANLPVGATGWAIYGAFVLGSAPIGTSSVQISLRATQGAVVDFDAVMPNKV